MKLWKRNAIVATVLVLLCAGVYLNWNSAQNPVPDLTQTLNADQLLNDATLVIADTQEASVPVSAVQEPTTEDYFAQIRLSRQESRDTAVELLQETIAFEDGSESATEAVNSLDHIVSDALAESQIESLVVAKGFRDCVAYMGEESISIAVSAPETGLDEASVALISDIVLTQTDYELSEIRIIEVK